MKNFPLPTLQQKVAFERDQKSYKSIFIHFYKPLINFAKIYVTTQEVAEEIVSDVLMKLWEMKENLNNILDLKVYLFKAVKNSAINYLTRDRKYTSGDIDNINIELNSSLISDDPNMLLEKKELKGAILSAVQELPPKCKMVYKLVRENGLSYREVSSIMNISENTVDRHLNTALHKIVRAVKAHF